MHSHQSIYIMRTLVVCFKSQDYLPFSGLVTPPKNQGACGSCAAFAAHGLHETCMLKAGAPFTNLDLSEQYIIDCGYDGK